MNTVEYAAQITAELSAAMEKLDPAACEKLCDIILDAKKILVAGAGRSGLAAKAFAMRLMHLGLTAYVCGETVTPNLEKGDLLLIVSGSGETGSLTNMAAKAAGLKASIALVTARPESTIGKAAHVTVSIPAPTPKAGNAFTSVQPMGSLFEQSCFLLLDAVVIRLMERKGIDSDSMYAHHANLE